MKIKRIVAYIIDIFIVSIISSTLFILPIFKNDYNNYANTTKEYTDAIINAGSEGLDYDTELDYLYTITKSSQPLTIITCGLMFIYFGVFSYLLNGQTIGKKIMKIKIVPTNGKKLNVNLYMIRTIILNNLLLRIASIISIIYLSKSNWIIADTIISYISNAVIFLIIGFMVFRDDERGLHDVICQTNVIECTKEKV